MAPSSSIPVRLLDGCRKGDPASQKEVYARYYGLGMNVTLRYSPTREEAAEVLNDAFIKVFRHIHRFNPAFPFTPWFRRIVVNTAIDHFRTTRKVPDMLPLMETDEPVEGVVWPETASDIDWLPLLRQLSPGYRIVFNLYVMEEYTHEEIGELLGITASASRSNLTRAKTRLRELLVEHYPTLINV